MFIHAHLIKINPLLQNLNNTRTFFHLSLQISKILFGNQKFWTKIWFDVSTNFICLQCLHIYFIYVWNKRNDWREIYRKRDVCCIVWDLRWRVFLIFDCFDSISQKFYSIIYFEEWLFVYLWYFSHQLRVFL